MYVVLMRAILARLLLIGSVTLSCLCRSMQTRNMEAIVSTAFTEVKQGNDSGTFFNIYSNFG